MKIAEIITEAITPIWGRKGGRMARRYRCTAGIRKGRIVASVATCNKPKNVKQSLAMKKNISRRGAQMRLKTSRTKRSTFSRRVKKLNVSSAKGKSPKFYKRKPIK
jgi:hypothetical protein